MTFEEMDTRVSLQDQLATRRSPVILVNVFHVDPSDADELMQAWTSDAEYFKSMPGFISTQLHRGIAGSGTFLNYAVWESVDHFREAFASPDFRSRLTNYPASAVASPHLFEKVAVPGLCIS